MPSSEPRFEQFGSIGNVLVNAAGIYMTKPRFTRTLARRTSTRWCQSTCWDSSTARSSP